MKNSLSQYKSPGVYVKEVEYNIWEVSKIQLRKLKIKRLKNKWKENIQIGYSIMLDYINVKNYSEWKK
jgi:hypothetical protein